MRTFNPRSPTYTVRPGDNLWNIALAQYGSADLAEDLGRTNAVVDPRLLIPGTVLRLPAIQVPDPVMLNYVVPGMKLIPQSMAMSCWYASARMLIWWRRHRLRQTSPELDPGEDPGSRALMMADRGLSNGQLVNFALRLGLVLVPPESPSAVAIDGWLRMYGPLWVNGKTHIVVIAGIRSGILGRRTELLVYDPSPVNTGLIQWRSLGGWYGGTAVDSRDTDISVPAVFMHCPL